MSVDVHQIYSTFIHQSRYSRWLYDEKRRETWEETVKRYMKFFSPRIPAKYRKEVSKELEEAILKMEVMPSMRALMTAGPALERDNAAGFNCSAVAVDSPRAFDEVCYLSLCGVGCGFSVERQYVNQLPTIAEAFYPTETVITVRDSKIGWATAFKELIALLYTGMTPTWDLTELRPAGAPLKIFGGRSSGSGPLNDLFKFTVNIFHKAAGRKLTSLECHDLMCKIADVVVSGGVRRSALISLSNLSDERMRDGKSGQWWIENGQRALANNSAVYTEKPEIGIFMKEWQALYNSKSGERGIFNRHAATIQAKKTDRRKWKDVEYLTNPCSEILLKSMQKCNLTEVIIRPEDTAKSLKRKIKLAAILGTLQSTVTDFRYLRKSWKKNAEEERLLGVSLTGIMDNPLTASPTSTLLIALKKVALDTNEEWAKRLGIERSVSVTCIKPSGTVSQLTNTSSGIHPRFSPYYIRSVRNDKRDPLGTFLKECKVPNEPDVTKPNEVDVFYFPMKSPTTSVMRNQVTAIQQLESYLMYYRYWCEHNVSITVYVRESEWLEVAAWVYKHFDEVGGISFLPFSDHSYRQAPYQEITEKEYLEAIAKFPTVDWAKLSQFEQDDRTLGAQTAACVGGSCEI